MSCKGVNKGKVKDFLENNQKINAQCEKLSGIENESFSPKKKTSLKLSIVLFKVKLL